MATFTEQVRNTAVYANESRNSSSFSAQAKSDSAILDNVVLSELESLTFEADMGDQILDDTHFNDSISLTRWSNQPKS